VALVLAPRGLALFDEKHVLWQVSSYGWLEVARNLMRDSHPPLYYWLAKGWWEIGGFHHPWTYRVFSVLLGLPAIPLAFQVGRLVGGARLGLALAAALMLNPLYLFLLVLIRMYGLVIALGALSTFLWLRLLERPTAARWAAWSVAQGALMFTHYYGLLLIGAQWLVVAIRRPRGWIVGALASLPWMAAFGGWIAQAYGGSLEHTVRSLSAIPVRPTPWEVVWHLWANLLVGPLADGRAAKAVALIGAALLGGSLLAARRSPRLRKWQFIAVAAGLPPAIGALLALRWPFFAARYFAMSVVPLVALIAAVMLRARWRPAFIALLLPGLVGIAGFPLLTMPLGLVGEAENTLRSLTISEPALVQAPWHFLSTFSYAWPDPAQRAQVVDRSPSFWFIGVTLYRAHWEGWLRDLQATHLIDFQAEFPHAIPEHQASVFHLVRKVPAARWTQPDARWANGIRLHEVGWAQEAVEPGRSAQWHLKFSADQPLDRRWTLFIHLVDEAGRLWVNWDAEPDPPTDRWVPGQVYDVGRSLLIPRFVPAGRYQVNLGWYETGTPGFPRLPLTVGGDVLTLGWIEVRPILGSALWGARSIGIVEMQPPEVIVRPSAEGWRIWVQVEWRAREPVPFSAWEVVLVAPEGPLPLQRAYRVPEGARGGSVWSVETWVSPELRGGWPALRWVEIRYAGHLLAREPVWLFPPSTTWSYDWLFLN
ncbi:MAG: glycosyltransferase family 39 protein, partial [Thermoflexus sp.]|uniref:glycosyltransferase family 39 protein n=1 Tax=Thermoflexus sp. TaxID=1969742 RepID=UPI0025DA9D75